MEKWWWQGRATSHLRKSLSLNITYTGYEQHLMLCLTGRLGKLVAIESMNCWGIPADCLETGQIGEGSLLCGMSVNRIKDERKEKRSTLAHQNRHLDQECVNWNNVGNVLLISSSYALVPGFNPVWPLPVLEIDFESVERSFREWHNLPRRWPLCIV